LRTKKKDAIIFTALGVLDMVDIGAAISLTQVIIIFIERMWTNMSEIESSYIKFKKGIKFFLEFLPSRGNEEMKAKLKVSGENFEGAILIKEVEVAMEYAKGLSLNYLSLEDFPKILEGVYQDRNGKSVIEGVVTEKLFWVEWVIKIDPYIWPPNPIAPDMSKLDYKIIFQDPPKPEFDFDYLGGTDDDICIPGSVMNQFIQSIDKKKLDYAFYEKYIDIASKGRLDEDERD